MLDFLHSLRSFHSLDFLCTQILTEDIQTVNSKFFVFTLFGYCLFLLIFSLSGYSNN